jgi:hypothetical protein
LTATKSASVLAFQRRSAAGCGFLQPRSLALAARCTLGVALDGSRYLGVGTHLKYYINEGGAYQDITPIRATTAAGDVTFDAVANTLSAGIDALQTTIPLTSSTGFPPSGLIQIGSEQIRYATVTGNDLEGISVASTALYRPPICPALRWIAPR